MTRITRLRDPMPPAPLRRTTANERIPAKARRDESPYVTTMFGYGQPRQAQEDHRVPTGYAADAPNSLRSA